MMSSPLLPFALFGLGLLCFAAFCWGVARHFRRTQRIPAGTKLISLCSLVGFGLFSYGTVASRPAILWPVSLVLFILAFLLFFWAVRATRHNPPTLAFDDDLPAFLYRQGPYMRIRHPFYLSYILFWLATALAFPGPLPWVFPLIMLIIYLRAATREERKFEHSALAAAYQTYRLRAGMFFPRFGPGSATDRI